MEIIVLQCTRKALFQLKKELHLAPLGFMVAIVSVNESMPDIIKLEQVLFLLVEAYS
jgi:hypothetical protein